MKKTIKNLFASLFAVLIIGLSGFAYAHFESENSESTKLTASLVQPDLFVAEYKTPIWFSIRDLETKETLNNLEVSAEIEKLNSGIIAKDIVVQQKGEEYMFEFSFSEFGNYKIHLNISRNKNENYFDFPIIVEPPVEGLKSEGIAFYFFAILGFLVLVFGIIKKKYKLGIIWFLILLALGGLVYSVIFTQKQDTSNGIITCPKASGECVWTAHIHAYMPINICGEYFRLRTEVGALNLLHTHEEKNLAHWHDKLPYDMETKSIKETENLLVKAFFSEIKVPIGEDRIASKKNGDLCPDGKPGTLRVFVNGIEKKDFLNYLWRDKDVIYFEFSDRDALEIQKELKEKPIVFPVLGRG
ncbi:MAG: hypothetical protein EXS49_01940 [Candidatus Pacebacteria bacterium]|nr:hypothetical protein [Candidatus Paceibacterota bacterium]